MFWTSFLWRSASKERPRDSTTEENEYLETELNNILRGQNINNNNNNNQLGFEKTNGSGWYLRKHFYFICGFWFPTNMSVSVNLWGINSSQQSLFNFICICASVFSFLMLVVSSSVNGNTSASCSSCIITSTCEASIQFQTKSLSSSDVTSWTSCRSSCGLTKEIQNKEIGGYPWKVGYINKKPSSSCKYLELQQVLMMPMKPKICTPIQQPGSPSPTSNCNFGFTSWEEAVRQPTSKSFDHSLNCYITNVSSESPRKTVEMNTPQKMWLIDGKSGGKNRRDRVYLKILKIPQSLLIWNLKNQHLPKLHCDKMHF